MNSTSIITVPTADPFLRNKNLGEGKPRTRKVLNPGSCASAMDLLARAGSIGSMQSFHHMMTTALNPNSCTFSAVPTADPFLRKRKLDEESQGTRKVLNRGSCSSAMDLLALAHAGSIGSMQSLHHMMTAALIPNPVASGHDLSNGLQGRGGQQGSAASSLHRAMTVLDPTSQQQGSTAIITVPTADPFLRAKGLDEEKQRTRKVLNPGSCASAMDLLALAGFQGQGSRRGSMASLSSAVSDASQLLRAIQGNVSQSSLFSASANGFALLLGSTSSSRGRGSNRNNARICRRANDQASDSNANADWDVFE